MRGVRIVELIDSLGESILRPREPEYDVRTASLLDRPLGDASGSGALSPKTFAESPGPEESQERANRSINRIGGTDFIIPEL